MREANETETFESLTRMLRRFKMKCKPLHESDIETGVERFLKLKGVSVRRQVPYDQGRFDLVVGKIVIEAKLSGQSNIGEQLDRYSSRCDGIILICWKASKPLRGIFKQAKREAKIPVELIEISKDCDMV